MRTLPITLLLLAAAPVSSLASPMSPSKGRPAKLAKLALTVTSSAFRANQPIPPAYTCDGAQASPPLAWSAVPSTARSIAILVEDPDAPGGTFTHWLITGISPDTTSLASGGPLPAGAMAARNGKGDVGYTPPCPPSGQHHYHFRVLALETPIPAPASKEDFLASIDGHVVAAGDLVGTYQKAPSLTSQK